jgi:hypothetical protein
MSHVHRGIASALRRIGAQHAANRRNELRPAVTLARQLFLPGGGEPIELRLLVRLRLPPFGFDPALPLEPMKGG